MNHTHLLALLAASTSFVVANVQAQAESSPLKATTLTVDYADLDLDSMTDARILYSRLEQAARRACGPPPSMQPRYDLMPEALERNFRKCRAQAVADAVARLDAPLVSQVYAEARQARTRDVAKR
jgi:UrcA family protein